MFMFIYLILIIGVNAQTDICGQIQQSGSTSCQDCVEITLLGGRPGFRA